METELGPVVILSGVTATEESVCCELKRRGFIVKHCMVQSGVCSAAVTLSKKLVAKLSAENNLPVQPLSSHTPASKLVLANSACGVILRSNAIGAKAAWVAHDNNLNALTDAVAKSSVSEPGKELLQINSYFGSQVALYYGFLSFYTKNLIPATIGGGLLFLYQLAHQQIDSAWLPVFCLSITVWSTLYLEQWKRRCSELAYAWGVYGSEDMELTVELAKGASKETGSVEVRRALSAVCLLSLITLQVLLMLRYNHLQAHAEEYFGRAWYTPYAPSVLYFAVCNLGGAVFYPISAQLNEFEMHPTKAQAEDSLVVKRFAFNFVNQFSVLFHAAFWQRDLHRVRTLSFYAFISHAAINQVLQQVLPRVKALYHTLTKKTKPVAPESNKFSASDSERRRGEEAEHWEALIAGELARPAVDLEDDYLEMALQFGHLSMFAVAFPLAPLLAYLNNVVEYRSDFSKLCAARRPPAQIRSSIGAWQSCFEFLSFASVFTNCFLLALVSSNIKAIIPGALHAQLDTDWGRLAAMMVVEHILIALKIGIMLVVDDVPQWLRESLARDKVRAEAERLQALVREPSVHSAGMSAWTSVSAPSTPTGSATPGSALSHQTPGLDDTPGTTASTPMESFSSKNTNHFLLAEQVAREDKLFGPAAKPSKHHHPGNDLASEQAASKLVKEASAQFGYDPVNLSALVTIPPLLAHYGISPFLYLPLAALYFSYLQASKDRADRKAALGIVSDPALVKLVMKELPRWVSDSEHQRVEWFNSVLQRLWPQLSLALEAQLIAQIQAVLDAQIVAVRVGLTVKRFSLGTISPKVVGIRLHETQESVIRLDIEIRWAGDPQLCISVGKSAFAPPVELSEIRFSALIRIELQDLMPALPCFRAVAVTFMKTPDVHFSLKIASLDFMNMGPADFNITALVRSAIDSVLQGMVVYPKKMMFPLVAESPEAAAEEHTHGANGSGASATGVLYLTFERGVNIKKSSLLWCNPYIVARTAKGQSFQSKAVYATRNPEWNQTFELLVFDAATQMVEVEVLDADPTRAGISLGRLNFGLHKLQTSQSVQCTVDLMEVDEGALVLTYEYIPMQKNRQEEESDSEDDGQDDILYSLSKTDLQSDVLCHSEEELSRMGEETLRRRSLPPAMHNGQRAPAPGAGLSRVVVSKRFASSFSVGIVSISMIHVRNLKIESYVLTAARPYVEVSVDGKVKSTKPVSGTTFPHYPEKFSFIVRDLANQKLLVAVKNRRKLNTAKELGSVEIPLSEAVLRGGTLEQEYLLHGAEAEFFVGLRLEVIASS